MAFLNRAPSTPPCQQKSCPTPLLAYHYITFDAAVHLNEAPEILGHLNAAGSGDVAIDDNAPANVFDADGGVQVPINRERSCEVPVGEGDVAGAGYCAEKVRLLS